MNGKENNFLAVDRDVGRGVAVLPLVIIASFLFLIIGMTIVFVAFFENQSAFSARKTEEARAAAAAGINDALRRLLLYPAFEGSYSLAVGNNTADVLVVQNVSANCSSFLLNSICIESLGKAQNRQSKIRAMISVNPETGQLIIVSRAEIST